MGEARSLECSSYRTYSSRISFAGAKSSTGLLLRNLNQVTTLGIQ